MEETATPPGALDFRVIRNELDTALEALTNLIDREWPASLASIPGARALLLTTIKVATVTYDSVRYLVRDYPRDWTPRPELAISIPPLSRSLLDQLFGVIFLAEDLPGRTRLFYRGGWRESKETLERYRERYGDQPAWEQWLVQYEGFLGTVREDWGVRQEEAAHPNQIDWWPTPGQMRQHDLQPATRTFLEYLDAWFYKTLSQDAHLSFPGLARRGAPLLLRPGEERDQQLLRRKSQGVFTTTTLILALATEFEHLLQYRTVHDRLAYVWKVLIEHWEEARDLYEMRYARFLDRGRP